MRRDKGEAFELENTGTIYLLNNCANGIARNAAKLFSNLAGRVTFRPELFQYFYSIFCPSHTINPDPW